MHYLDAYTKCVSETLLVSAPAMYFPYDDLIHAFWNHSIYCFVEKALLLMARMGVLDLSRAKTNTNRIPLFICFFPCYVMLVGMIGSTA